MATYDFTKTDQFGNPRERKAAPPLDWVRLAKAGMGYPFCAWTARASGLYPDGPEADATARRLISEALWRDAAVRFLVDDAERKYEKHPSQVSWACMQIYHAYAKHGDSRLYAAVEAVLKAEGRLT